MNTLYVLIVNMLYTCSLVLADPGVVAKVGDFSEEKGMGILPDPFEGGTYNLLS